jgi:multidrug resistance efflux pump
VESSSGPKLRFDLKIKRGSSDPSTVVVDDPVTHRQHRLSEIECLVAQHMDGSMSTSDLLEIAAEADASWDESKVRSFVGRLGSLGLIDGQAPEPTFATDDLEEEFDDGATVAPAAVSRLRFDLRMRPHETRKDLMWIDDLRTRDAHVFTAADCLVAQHMDGERTISDLHLIGSAHDPGYSLERTNTLVERIARLGLFAMADEEDGADPRASTNVEEIAESTGPHEMEPILPPLPPSLGRLYPEDAEKTNVADVRESGIFKMLEIRAGRAYDDPAESIQDEDEVLEADTANPQWGGEEKTSAEDELVKEAAFADAGLIETPAPDLEPAPGPAWAPGSAGVAPESFSPPLRSPEIRDSFVDISIGGETGGDRPPTQTVQQLPGAPTLPDQKPEDVFARPRWTTRPWVRRGRVPALAVAIAGGLALVPYNRYVTEECRVLPSSRVEVRAQLDGIISEILVDEGDVVLRDQVIVRLLEDDIKASVQQAQSRVAQLQANVEKMKGGSRPEEIAKARTAVAAAARDVKFAKIEYKRRQKLFAQGVGSAELRDNAHRDLELKEAALSRANAELRLMMAGYRREDIDVAQAELEGAKADLSHLESKADRHQIRSPIEGVILTPKFREHLHQKVAAGDMVCEVASTNKVRVEIFVPEREIDLVRLGQATVVKVQSLPLHPFEGKVNFVAPAVEERDGQRFVRVVTVIDNEEGLLQEGMTGYGEVNTGQSTLLKLALRRAIRWVRVRFLI